jgi:hypothetical protein
VDTPVLNAIFVEGAMTFLDGAQLEELHIDAKYIIVNMG